MEAWLLASEFLGIYGVFWYQLVSEIEAFQLHLVTMNYGEGAVVAEKVGMLDDRPHNGTVNMEGAN